MLSYWKALNCHGSPSLKGILEECGNTPQQLRDCISENLPVFPGKRENPC
jgi:hypothetical protein